MPPNPAGWITTTTKRKAIDAARRDQVRTGKYQALAQLQEEHYEIDTPLENWEDDSDALAEDDRLRLIFTCCHPALNLE